MNGAFHLSGGGPVLKRFKVGETITPAGQPINYDTANQAGVSELIAVTGMTFIYGTNVDTATFSTTQGDAEGLVTISIRPDLVMRALASGGATEGTALTLLSNTAASAAGTVITDADVGAADMDGGTVWCTSGANVGLSRQITTHTASTSFTVTVPFPRTIAVGDEFLFVPWSLIGDGTVGEDGNANVQVTTLNTQADATIASGTGGEVTVVELELNGRSDSYVQFLIADNIFGAGNQTI